MIITINSLPPDNPTNVTLYGGTSVGLRPNLTMLPKQAKPLVHGQVSSNFPATENGEVSSNFTATKNDNVIGNFAAEKNDQVSSNLAAAKNGQVGSNLIKAKNGQGRNFCCSQKGQVSSIFVQQIGHVSSAHSQT